MGLGNFLKNIFGSSEREENTQEVRSTASSSTSAAPWITQRQNRQAQPQPQEDDWEPQPERTEAEWMAYFREILATEFSQYAVRENVAVQELAGNVSAEFQLYATRPQQVYKAEWGKPYDFVLYSNDRVKGVIIIGKRINSYNNVKNLISKMYAKKMGIPFVAFYMDTRNKRDYVIKHIREYVH